MALLSLKWVRDLDEPNFFFLNQFDKSRASFARINLNILTTNKQKHIVLFVATVVGPSTLVNFMASSASVLARLCLPIALYRVEVEWNSEGHCVPPPSAPPPLLSPPLLPPFPLRPLLQMLRLAPRTATPLYNADLEGLELAGAWLGVAGRGGAGWQLRGSWPLGAPCDGLLDTLPEGNTILASRPEDPRTLLDLLRLRPSYRTRERVEEGPGPGGQCLHSQIPNGGQVAKEFEQRQGNSRSHTTTSMVHIWNEFF